MTIKNYSNLNQSTTTRASGYLINLKKEYGEGTELLLTNKEGNNFNIFLSPLEELSKNFNSLTKEAIGYRTSSVEEYLSSGYLASEINYSLKAEGVHSSRKIVDTVLKAKREGKNLSDDQVEKLISNYYDALSFVLSNNSINERNINTLYGIVSADLPDVIEEGHFYRQGEVRIGEDLGMPPELIVSKIKELISFLDSDLLKENVQTKALIAHYVFENIHPYYEYNGRMGRLLHLWVLINHSREEFWKLVFLSEAIFLFKESFDTTFNHILKAKKNEANIDLTYFVGSLFQIFNAHTNAYIQMKKLTNDLPKNPSRHLRSFIIDILCETGHVGKWYSINDFKKRYSDYSNTVYDRLLKEIKSSNIFQVRDSKPIQFRLTSLK